MTCAAEIGGLKQHLCLKFQLIWLVHKNIKNIETHYDLQNKLIWLLTQIKTIQVSRSDIALIVERMLCPVNLSL